MASTSSNQGQPEVDASVVKLVSTALTKRLQVLDVDYKLQRQPTICKVPHDVREGNGDAYDPRLISIGPYHHRKEALKPMQEIKLLYLHQLLSRSEHNQVEKYAKAIQRREDEIRKQYSHQSDHDSKEFLEMLVLDGCFIVEFLFQRKEGKVGQPMTTNIRNLPLLRRDLLLLENQIPFLVLNTILEESKFEFSGSAGITLVDLALHYLHKGKITKVMLHNSEDNIYHLLHLDYLCCLIGLQKMSPMKDPRNQFMVLISTIVHGWSFLLKKIKFFRLLLIGIVFFIIISIETLILWKRPRWFRSTNWFRSTTSNKPTAYPGELPTAMELDKAGMLLRKKGGATTFLDVSFVDEKLELPSLKITGNSNSKFGNMIALEQSCQNIGNYFSSYVVLMKNLIKTTSDATLLRDRGIIQNSIGGDEDVVRFFNHLGSVTVLKNNEHQLGGVFKEVNEYCNQIYNRWRARIMNDYMDHPKVIFAFIGALIVIGLTTVQTTFTIIN